VFKEKKEFKVVQVQLVIKVPQVQLVTKVLMVHLAHMAIKD
jgi:hypothetical protein